MIVTSPAHRCQPPPPPPPPPWLQAPAAREEGLSPWQAPPAFFAHRLVSHLAACDSELRWGLRISALRALSRSWRDAGEARLRCQRSVPS